MKPLNLSDVITSIGGPVAAAKLCNRSRPAIDKWLANGHLPRTEYTGETQYAAILAAASNGKFNAENILAACRPGQVNAKTAI